MSDIRERLRSACVPYSGPAVFVWLGVIGSMALGEHGAAQEPPNPFGTVRPERTDARAGVLELSNGRKICGHIYLTRGHMLRVYDAEVERFREIPLRVISRIDCEVEKEWDEREWRFRENANDEKVYTGRTYPVRVYHHVVTLERGEKISGPLAALVYIIPDRIVEPRRAQTQRQRDEVPNRARTRGSDRLRGSEPSEPASPFAARAPAGNRGAQQKFMLHKRDKGEPGTTLEELVYVKCIVFGTLDPEATERDSAVGTQTPQTE